MKALGITYYFSCAPICDGVTGTRSTAENLEKYYQKAVARLDCPVISHPADYRFANEQYYNSNYHLCTAAGIIRTDKTIEDLLAQWEYEQSLLK